MVRSGVEQVGKLRLVTGDVDPANLVVVNRVSHVEAYQVNSIN